MLSTSFIKASYGGGSIQPNGMAMPVGWIGRSEIAEQKNEHDQHSCSYPTDHDQDIERTVVFMEDLEADDVIDVHTEE